MNVDNIDFDDSLPKIKKPLFNSYYPFYTVN
jgi:hypothetical protein